MGNLVLDAPRIPTVPVRGGGAFPVRRIYCVGRNYTDHILEMGGDTREPPFFFQKPADAIVHDGGVVPYPSCTSDFQHEVELVLAIGREGSNIARADAAAHVWAASVGIDLTRRDVQIQARKSGRPWEIGKSFDHSAPCGDLVPINGQLPVRGAIELRVNGQLRQRGDLAQLIWACDEIVSQLSQQYRLVPGDLIYTGTPAGVGSVIPGDRVEASIEGIASMRIGIAVPPQ
ncbi:fumarylacetoacetate hydrolase family protein [Variovorax paradoxus]|nr:fumarylacetoacetate hydrolase family protein [Variovorax paradoxus]MBT2304049.1 fumarylacetoacetate hydrolase family protein [Variovorax paradoxus]